MIYILSSIFIIIINIFPAFMPPTWTVISFIYITFDINLPAMTIIGAVSSSFGRYILANISYKVAPKAFNDEIVENLVFVGNKINGGTLHMFVVAFVWALLPIGSNPLFIAVGLSGTKLKSVITGFFVGRIISYFSLAYASNIAYKGVRVLFVEGIINWRTIVINMVSLLVIYLYIALDWKELFMNKRLKFNLWIFKRNSNRS